MTILSAFIAAPSNDMFKYADMRTALANRVTGYETPEQLAAIQAVDKTLSLKQESAKVQYEYVTAQQEQLAKMMKQKHDQRKRLFDMGAIFG